MKRISYIENFTQWREGFSFFEEVKVRFSETDMYGHLNNTIPFTYYEVARIEFFKHLGFMQSWLDPNGEKIPVVADLQCDFWKQVYFGETLRIYVKVHQVGTSSLDLHYLAVNEKDEPVFTGRGAVVQISKITGKSVPWTDEEKVEWNRCMYLG